MYDLFKIIAKEQFYFRIKMHTMEEKEKEKRNLQRLEVVQVKSNQNYSLWMPPTWLQQRADLLGRRQSFLFPQTISSLPQASLFRFIIVLFHPEDQEWPINPVEMTIKPAKNLINTSSKHNLFSCVQPRLLELN